MLIEQFGVEIWMNEHENDARWNLGETCIDSLTVDGLLGLSDDAEAELRRLRELKLTYGDIPGSRRLRELISALFASIGPDQVLVTQGAIGANFLAEYTLVEPGDLVVCVEPTYQQLHAVPESLGAEVRLLTLRPEQGFLPDIARLRELCAGHAKLIVLNNPNNPTGALMTEAALLEVVEVARSCDAYILCDEVYRGLEHDRSVTTPSIADLYEKGVVSGSMSRLLERNLGILLGNKRELERWVASEECIDWVSPQAGTTAFLRYDLDLPSAQFAQELFDLNGTFLVPGSEFGWERWLRVGFACAPETLRGGLEGLSAYLRRRGSGGR